MAAKSLLTDAKILGLKPPADGRDEYPDAKVNGLRVRVGSSGSKSFTLRTRVGGRTRNVTLGQYPRLSLAEARKKAGTMLSDIEVGSDPVTAHVASKRGQGNGTVNSLVEQYLAAEVRGKKRSAVDIERVFNRDILPRIGERMADAISRRDVTLMVDDVTNSGGRVTPRAGRMAHQLLSAFYSWALSRLDAMPGNPCRDAGRPKVSQPRDRVFSEAELAALWRAAIADGHPFGTGIQLLILTAQRRSEVFDAKWSEFDLAANLWTVPGERAKNGKANLVPLSPAALKVLKAIPRVDGMDWLFPSQGDDKRTFSGFRRAWTRLLAAVVKEAGSNEHATIHDIRRTVATGLERIGVALPVSEAVLNHQSGSKSGIAAVYHRHAFADEKRAALIAWANEVQRIAAKRAETELA